MSNFKRIRIWALRGCALAGLTVGCIDRADDEEFAEQETGTIETDENVYGEETMTSPGEEGMQATSPDTMGDETVGDAASPWEERMSSLGKLIDQLETEAQSKSEDVKTSITAQINDLKQKKQQLDNDV